jgi:hypothetical protein
MRILRGVSSRLLACGCLAGVYETYDGDIVTILDARGAQCVERTHEQELTDLAAGVDQGDHLRFLHCL